MLSLLPSFPFCPSQWLCILPVRWSVSDCTSSHLPACSTLVTDESNFFFSRCLNIWKFVLLASVSGQVANYPSDNNVVNYCHLILRQETRGGASSDNNVVNYCHLILRQETRGGASSDNYFITTNVRIFRSDLVKICKIFISQWRTRLVCLPSTVYFFLWGQGTRDWEDVDGYFALVRGSRFA